MKEKLYTVAVSETQETHHVFESNNDENNYDWDENKPLCGHDAIEYNDCNFTPIEDRKGKDVFMLNSKQARILITNIKNDNESNLVCGLCASVLYGGDDIDYIDKD